MNMLWPVICCHAEIVVLRAILLGVLLGVLVCAGLAACLVKAAEEPMTSKIDAIFSPVADAHSPGVAVLVREDGRIVFERGYGVRDLRTLAKIDTHTNFRLASCTKQFTAMAIMLLVHAGKLRYEDKLTDVFPDFPTYGKTITIRHLLNHTSGLPDYEDLMVAVETPRNSWVWSEARQIQDSEVLHLLEHEKTGKFSPGTKWAYSNSGYVVLGLVVAKVSGMPFSNFLQQRIFAPLQMNRHARVSRKAKTKSATGPSATPKIRTRGNKPTKVPRPPRSAMAACILRLTISQNGTKPRASHFAQRKRNADALTPVKLTGDSAPKWPSSADRPEGTPVAYGFGWFLDPYRGHARMWHYGETMGFRTYIERFVDDKLYDYCALQPRRSESGRACRGSGGFCI